MSEVRSLVMFVKKTCMNFDVAISIIHICKDL